MKTFAPARTNRLPALILVTSLAASGLLLTPLSATAAPVVCSNGGTLISGNVCEVRYNSNATFTPTPSMHKIEALLVGRGGSGILGYTTYSTYGVAGSGGEVAVHTLSGSGPIAVTVASTAAGTSAQSSVEQSGQRFAVNNGADGNPATVTSNSAAPGANGPNPDAYDGGPGKTAAEAGGPASLFATDHSVYGSGGAMTDGTRVGIPGDGAGYFSSFSETDKVNPSANRGGGGGTISNSASGGSTSGADGVVVIRWTERYTATFEMNGNGTQVPAQHTDDSDLVAMPATPTASGYIFDKWYSDASLSTPADFTTPLSENTTFYAKWIPISYTVSFNLNGRGTAITSQTVLHGDVATQPATPTASGYIFGGWYSDAALTKTADFTAGIIENTVLYAKWTPEPITPQPTPEPQEPQEPNKPTPEPQEPTSAPSNPAQDPEDEVLGNSEGPDNAPSTEVSALPDTGSDVSGAAIGLAALLAGAGTIGVAVSKRRRHN